MDWVGGDAQGRVNHNTIKNAIPFSKKMRLRRPCTMEIKMDNTKDQLEILQRQLGLSK